MSEQPPQDGPTPYPSAPPLNEVGRQSVPRPASVTLAVRLMYLGTVLSLLGTLISLSSKDAFRTKIAEQAAKSHTTVNVDAATNAAIGVAVFSGVVGALIWFVMARLNASGRRWARILGSVLALINLLSLLGVLASRDFTALSLTASLVSVVLGASIVVLLWRPESSRFYASR